jgi:hypothetical protein
MTMAMASVLLVLYVNGPIVAHADDSQQTVDSQQPVDQCGGEVYDCQYGQDNAQSAPVADFGNQTNFDNNSTFY